MVHPFRSNVYFVAITRCNINPAMVFEFLYQTIRIYKAYFDTRKTFEEKHVRKNMTLVYELLDETMDYGYPQVSRPPIPFQRSLIYDGLPDHRIRVYQSTYLRRASPQLCTRALLKGGQIP